MVNSFTGMCLLSFWELRPSPPTGTLPQEPTGDFRPQAPSFAESKKILQLYCAYCLHQGLQFSLHTFHYRQGRSQSFSLGFFPFSPPLPSLLFSPYFPFPSLQPSLPSPNPAIGSGERCQLPDGVRGGAPAANAFWGYFEAGKRFWWKSTERTDILNLC